MTLRTRRPHPAGATSGPGRPRLSDGRLRHRHGRRPAAPRDPAAAAVRRRAEALLGGSGPPQAAAAAAEAPPARAPLAAEPGGPDQAAGAAPAAGVPERRASAGPEPPPAVSWAALRWLAVRERLPMWVQARCGVEPRAVAAVAVVLAAAAAFGVQQYLSSRPEPVTAPAVVAPASPAASAGAPGPAAKPPAAAGGGQVVVDVSGTVREPGVRRLPAGSRVEDALAAAGGVRPGTDTTGLNRARVLVDGEQVLVGVPAPALPAGAAPRAGAGPAAGPLSLGTATVEQLDGLPGVGPVLARNIVDFRTARGGFRSVEELRQVDGIGERRFSDLRKLVRP